jgi:hypothetical protein
MKKSAFATAKMTKVSFRWLNEDPLINKPSLHHGRNVHHFAYWAKIRALEAEKATFTTVEMYIILPSGKTVVFTVQKNSLSPRWKCPSFCLLGNNKGIMELKNTLSPR